MSDPRFFPPGVPEGLRFPPNPRFGDVWPPAPDNRWWFNGVAWLFGSPPATPGPGTPGIPSGLVVVPINQVVIMNSTQYIPRKGLVLAIVELKGGGGPGGGVTATTGVFLVGGGGGSGAFTRGIVYARDIGAGINVTIGQGGTGAAGGGGTNGLPTSFGTLLNAPGGLSGGVAAGGAGGPAMANPPIGTVAMSGDPGGDGSGGTDTAGWAMSPAGGSGVYGGGAPGVASAANATATGRNGQNGGGGSGAAGFNAPGAAPGGSGGNGWAILTEYVLANPRELMVSSTSSSAAALAAASAEAPAA